MTIDLFEGRHMRALFAPDTEGMPGGEALSYGEEPAATQPPADAGAQAETTALDAEVPEDGTYDFALPEGVSLDTELAAQAMPILKEAGLTRAQANAMAGFLADVRSREGTRIAENWAKTQTDWVHQVKTDKEIGGENFSSSVAASNRLIARLGTPEFIDYLQSSGAGNHPEMVRFCSRVAAALSEDSPVSPEVPAGSRRHDPVDILYPTSSRG